MTEIIVRGKLVTGLGQGSHFTQLDWVKAEFLRLVGFVPYPGTFNVKVDPQDQRLLSRLKKGKAMLVCPPTTEFCEARSFRCRVNGQVGAIVIPLVKDYWSDILEIVAPVKLTQALSLKEGDPVTVSIEI